MAQKRLRETDEKFRAIFENTPAGLLITDSQGVVLDCNRRFTEIFGAAKEQYVGTNLLERLPEGPVRQNLADAIADGKPRRYEGPYRSVISGRDFFLTITSERATSGIVYTVIDDLTRIKRSEEALRLEGSRLSLALEAANQGWFDLDLQTGRVESSEELARILGYEPGELSTSLEDALEQVHPDDRESVRSAIRRGLASGRVLTKEYRRRTKDGQWKWMRSVGRVVQWDADGRPLRMSGIHADISVLKAKEEKLREASHRAGAIFNFIPDPLSLADLGTGKVIDVNDACARLLGLPRDQIVGKTSLELQVWDPADRDDIYRRMRAGGEITDAEYVLRTSEGERRRVLFSCRRVEVDGQPALLSSFRDVTDRRAAEEALRRSEVRYRRLYESMTDAVATVDMSGRIVDFNPAFQRMLGYSAPELLRLTYEDLTPERWHAIELRILREQLLATGHAESYEKEYRRRDGTVFPVELHTYLLKDESGEPAGMWAIIRDISERKKAEEELRASEEKYRTVFHNELYPICIFDVETFRFLEVNEAHARLYGYPRHELLGMTGPDVSAEPRESFRTFADLREAESTLVPLRYHRKKDGTVFPVELFVGRYSMGGRSVAVSLIRDITEQKRAEEALRKANEDLEATVQRRTVQLENAKRLLELDIDHREKVAAEREHLEAQLRRSQTLEAVGRLAGGVAHDFNNLLASVLACAWAARLPGVLPEGVHRELDRIQELCKQGGEVTRQLLAVARQTKGVTTALDLNLALYQLRLLVGRACPKTVSVTFDVAPDLPHVQGDRGLLTTALLNVCLNARDAMPGGGTLSVRARRERLEGDEWAVVEVADTGEGIPEKIREQVFQPFFTTKGGGRGAGLGLPMALATANSMGGSLEVVSEPGRGATFCFRLPGCRPPEGLSDGAEGAAPREEPLAAMPGTVLVVEDEEDVARFVVENLTRGGCAVLRARTGLEALEILRTHGGGLGLILLDLVLPELSGATVHRALAAGAPGTPVVFMTGREDLGEEVDPDVPVLRKPFSGEELLARVRRATAGGD